MNKCLYIFYAFVICFILVFFIHIFDNKGSFYIAQKEISLSEGSNLQINLKSRTKGNVHWNSSDDTIAMVDQNGIVTGINAGTAEITARNEAGDIATAFITVYESNNGFYVSDYTYDYQNTTTTTNMNNTTNNTSNNTTNTTNTDTNNTTNVVTNNNSSNTNNTVKTNTTTNNTSTNNTVNNTTTNSKPTVVTNNNTSNNKQTTNNNNNTNTNNTNKNNNNNTNSNNNSNKNTNTNTNKTTNNNNKNTNTNTNKTTDTTNKNVKVIDSTYTTIIANYNVKDYGAKGDGVTDDTQAFKNALAAAKNCVNQATCYGYTVYVPKGKYLIKDSLELGPTVGLVGELAEGTSNGTILVIDFGEGTTNYNKAAIKMDTQSAVMNIAFWYPKQGANSNGYTIAYPPTIVQIGVEGLTLDNINFINSYIAMDFASHHYNNSIQHLSNIYGAPFSGFINDTNLDTIRITNLNFNANYWLNSGLSNIPSADSVRSALKNKGVGLMLERVDWFFLAGIKIDNYNVGIHLRNAINKDYANGDATKNAEGEMYDIQATNCNYPLLVESARNFTITKSKFTTTHQSLAAIEIKASDNISINSSELSGKKAINNYGSGNISISDSKVSGTIYRANNNSKFTFINDSLTNTGYDGSSVSDNSKKPTDVSYNKRVKTKPISNNIVVINANHESDITTQLKDAINSLRSTGGIVYIPAGNYYVNDHIDVYSGIEIRGTTPWAHNWSQSGREYVTRITTTYNQASLFTLYSNAGINGLTIVYNNQSVTQYPATIQGNGSNIYITNISLPNAWKGIDLATYRCDNHYVANIWGDFLEYGIKVGAGSYNGIVKECHFTINAMKHSGWSDLNNKWQYLINHQVAFEIGNSTNELLFHNFVYNPSIGYNVSNGAKSFTILGCGADASGKYAINIKGNVNGQIVNPLLVTLGSQKWCAVNPCFDSNFNPNLRRYIKTEDSFTGYINIVNSISWGNDSAIAFEFGGKGDIHIYSGIVDNTANPVIRNSNSLLSVFGLIIKQDRSSAYEINKGCTGAHFAGNVCANTACTNKLKNNAGINTSTNNNGVK